ncbi:hypothetical protein [Paenibacillus xanthanilyticus]|uniref:Uncharacterized protein n=1 Tax=Paenibacillus xanthanilyticus TaxID=1783531 RepID=A0ABV8K8K4_9BACL
MDGYVGIEKIDPIERLKQHEITKILWQSLCEKGIREGDKGRIKAFLFSNLYEHAKELEAQFKGEFEVVIFKEDEGSEYIIEITTPVCRLSNEALEEVADILMISAADTNTKFDGFELDVNEVKKLNKPWWRIW